MLCTKVVPGVPGERSLKSVLCVWALAVSLRFLSPAQPSNPSGPQPALLHNCSQPSPGGFTLSWGLGTLRPRSTFVSLFSLYRKPHFLKKRYFCPACLCSVFSWGFPSLVTFNLKPLRRAGWGTRQLGGLLFIRGLPWPAFQCTAVAWGWLCLGQPDRRKSLVL